MSCVASQTHVDIVRLGKILDTTFFTSILSYLLGHICPTLLTLQVLGLLVPFRKTFEVKPPS